MASLCPGLARQASGLPSVTPRELTLRLVQHCALIAFASPLPRRDKLATEGNSPARFSERMMQLLRAASYYNLLFSSSFHSLLRELFSIPSRYLYAIGLEKYLELDFTVTHIHARILTHTTLFPNLPYVTLLRGYHTLWLNFPEYFAKPHLVIQGSTSPHSCLCGFSLFYSAFARRY